MGEGRGALGRSGGTSGAPGGPPCARGVCARTSLSRGGPEVAAWEGRASRELLDSSRTASAPRASRVCPGLRGSRTPPSRLCPRSDCTADERSHTRGSTGIECAEEPDPSCGSCGDRAQPLANAPLVWIQFALSLQKFVGTQESKKHYKTSVLGLVQPLKVVFQSKTQRFTNSIVDGVFGARNQEPAR